MTTWRITMEGDRACEVSRSGRHQVHHADSLDDAKVYIRRYFEPDDIVELVEEDGYRSTITRQFRARRSRNIK